MSRRLASNSPAPDVISKAVRSDLTQIVRYDITQDDYLPITQEWVTEVQNKVTELAIKLKKKDEQIEMLEAMLKVQGNEDLRRL